LAAVLRRLPAGPRVLRLGVDSRGRGSVFKRGHERPACNDAGVTDFESSL